MVKAIAIPKNKNFNGKEFNFSQKSNSRSNAKKAADGWKLIGYNARIVRFGFKRYGVYIRKSFTPRAKAKRVAMLDRPVRTTQTQKKQLQRINTQNKGRSKRTKHVKKPPKPTIRKPHVRARRQSVRSPSKVRSRTSKVKVLRPR